MIIVVFAHPIVRKRAYRYFWWTHQLYWALYFFAIAHGLARLTGAPRFWMFLVGPGIIYVIDKVSFIRTISIYNSCTEISQLILFLLGPLIL